MALALGFQDKKKLIWNPVGPQLQLGRIITPKIQSQCITEVCTALLTVTKMRKWVKKLING